MKNYKFQNQVIYFKTCENMGELQDSTIDLIVTSPPYNRKKTYSSDEGKIYNDHMIDEDYLNFIISIWRECYRVAKKSAIFFLNIGDAANDQGKSEKVAEMAELAGWFRIQDIIWVKSFLGRGHYTPSGGNKRFNNIWEHIYIFVKDKKNYTLDTKAIGIPYADKSNIGRYGESDLRDPGNVWLIPYDKTTGAKTKKGHEAPFPIGLPYNCIKCVPDVKTVLDPFCGTGTTLAACINLGIKGIGYEKYPRIDIIKNRLKEGLRFKPHTTILIPHYELSINILYNYLNTLDFEPPDTKTKKESIERAILIDVLQNLGIDNSFIKKLLPKSSKSIIKKDKSNLLSYFKKMEN